MSMPHALKHPKAPKPIESLCSNCRVFQATLKSASSQKRREAVQRRIIIEEL